MADFRRWILAFAMLVLVLGFVAPANAQLSCTAAAAVVPTLRHEGFTELTGDILLTCTAASGAVPLATGHIVPTANISVSLSAPITSRVLGGTNPQYLTEALLVVNDPAPADQVVCLFPTNPAVACQMYAGTPSFNVFQGLGCVSTATINCAPAANTVTFQGIPADPPVTTRTYRITNIRIDATGVPLGTGGGGTTPVNAYVSVSPSSSISVSNPQPLVGVVGWGLVNTQPTSTGATLYQCENFSGKLGQVIFTENFATAFKTQGAVTTAPTAYPQNTPGVPYNTESGLEIAVSNGAGKTAEAGAADSPTELEATIKNIPVGAVITVDSFAVSTGEALCAAGAPAGCVDVLSDANLLLPVVNPTPGVDTQVTVADNTKGTAPIAVTVVWQISHTNPAAIDSLSFNVYGSVKAQTGNPTTLTGAATVSIGFYPQAASYPSPSAGPIPEFSSTVEAQNPSPTNLFSISPCQTILLFPYVTDFTGFDTGLAISNTSMDGLSSNLTAGGQTGTCSVTFFGGGAVATTLGTNGIYASTADTALTSGLINPGQTWVFSMSQIDPGYNSTPTYGTTGYAIATCQFQYAHGYSFVSDTGIRNFAAAYLALIVPDVPRAAQPFTCSTGTEGSCSLTGEQLVH